jgi:hypothetical protein
MTLIPPVAPPAISQADAPTPNASLTPEHQAFEYAMEVEQSALMDNGRMANPATMVSEMLNGLRGFLERAQRMSKRIEQIENRSQGRIRTADASNEGSYGLTPYAGPAHSSLDSIGGDFDRPASDFDRPASDKVSREIEFAMHISDELFDSAIFNIQAQLIAKGAGDIAKASETLVKGQ